MTPMTRRTLLTGGGLALINAVVGCGVDPRIHSQTDTDQPIPGWRPDLVNRLRQASSVARAQSAAWADDLADGFDDQAARLASTDPLGGVQADLSPLPQFSSPTPSPSPSAPLDELATTVAETALAARASELDDGGALLLSSVEILARIVATTDPTSLLAPVAGPAVPAETSLDEKTCWEQLVQATDALVFALGAVLGHTTDTGRAADLATRLGQAQRDQQDVVLAAATHGVTWVTDPDPALPGDPADPATQETLLGTLELAVMNAWARIHALDASLGADAAVAHGQRAMQGGVPVPTWPGWV